MSRASTKGNQRTYRIELLLIIQDTSHVTALSEGHGPRMDSYI